MKVTRRDRLAATMLMSIAVILTPLVALWLGYISKWLTGG